MPELQAAELARVAPLLPPGYGMAAAVLSGNARGRVWADSAQRPSRALIATIEVWVLVGAPGDDGFEEELARVFQDEVLTGRAMDTDHEEVGLTCVDPAWAGRLAGLFGGRDLLSDPRQYYEVEAARLTAAPLPEGYERCDVDAAFLERQSQARGWIEDHYLGHGDFLARSAATVLLQGSEPACWCITDCVEGEAAEVGIETDPAHRRRGLAAAAVTITCARLFERGVRRIGWHCHARNAGSVRTALRSGFSLVREDPGLFRMFDPVRHELVRGFCLLEVEADAPAALAHLQEVLTEHPDLEARWTVLAARAAVRSGEEGLGRELLRAAYAGGWPGPLEDDAELTALWAGLGGPA